MKTSESLGKISQALLKAQRQIGAVKKTAANPFFKSKFANLESVIAAVKDALNDNEIVILQPHTAEGVVTTLLHSSGEYISGLTPLVVAKERDPQALGSAISYARRYGLQSLVCLPAEDDDAESAMQRAPAKKAKNSDF